MHTYSYTKILKFYKFRTFGVFYENLQYILLLKNFNIKIQYQKFKEYIMSLRLPDMTSNRNGLLTMAYLLYRYVTRTNISFFDPSPNNQRTEHSCA